MSALGAPHSREPNGLHNAPSQLDKALCVSLSLQCFSPHPQILWLHSQASLLILGLQVYNNTSNHKNGPHSQTYRSMYHSGVSGARLTKGSSGGVTTPHLQLSNVSSRRGFQHHTVARLVGCQRVTAPGGTDVRSRSTYPPRRRSWRLSNGGGPYGCVRTQGQDKRLKHRLRVEHGECEAHGNPKRDG